MVRERIVPFNADGIDSLADLPSTEGKRRLTEAERSTVHPLVTLPPPGRSICPGDRSRAATDDAGDALWPPEAFTAL